MRQIFLLTIAFAVSLVGAASAKDISGAWSIIGVPQAKILVEQQTASTRIAVVDADELGLAYEWYIGSLLKKIDTAAVVRVEALALRRLFGRPDISTTVVGFTDLDLAFADPFRGTLKVGTRTFDIERKPLVADGLISPIDAEAPETGWYSGTGVYAFAEGQGDAVILTTLGNLNGRPGPAVTTTFAKSGAGTWKAGAATISAPVGRVTGFARTTGTVSETFTRYQTGNSTKPFIEDLSPSLAGVDADRNGIRDDIDVVIGDTKIVSQRVRFGLTELATAYQAYLAAPSTATAQAATTRTMFAKACIDLLASGEKGDAVELVESLHFNTSPRIKALDQLPVLAGPQYIPIDPVSLSDPNRCAEFTPGITRRFDLSTASDIRAARSRRMGGVADKLEQSLAANRMKMQGPAAVSSTKTCGATKILLVTGVKTNQESAEREQLPALKDILKRNRLDPGDFDYGAIADANPGYLNDSVQYLVGQLNVTDRQAQEMISSGFRSFFVGLVKVVLVKTPAGFVGGGVNVTEGALNGVAGIIAKNAVQRNAADVAGLVGELVNNVSNNQRTIAVPHSRGNLRINDAFSSSSANIRRTVGIASIANAASGVATGGTGATRDDDRVLKATRLLSPPSERPTIFSAGEPKSWDGHKLVESYLNNPRAVAEILSRLRSALARASLPAPGQPRVLASQSGGFTGNVAQTANYNIGRSGVTFRLEYQAYTLPDRFDVIYRGKRIATTGGVVSGGGNLNVSIPVNSRTPADGNVIVAVYGPDPDTAWDYTIHCPTTLSLPANLSAPQ